MLDFQRRYDQHERRFNFVWRLAIAWIIFCAVLVVGGIGFSIYVGVRYADKVEQHGLKNVLLEIWEGPPVQP